MSDYPIEALLRPPVEYLSAFVSGSAAVVSILAPDAILMVPEVAWACAIVFASISVHRFTQGLKITRYQRGMRRLPLYAVKSKDIPVSHRQLFIGKGFRWTQTHTQRYKDTLNPNFQKYISMGDMYYWVRKKEIAWEDLPILKYMRTLTTIDHPLNPVRPLPPVGGRPTLHAVEPNEDRVWLPLVERVAHTLVLGTTRVGKTRLAEVLITQDIMRGEVVVVFDPKGDADLLKRMYAEAERAGRADDFYVFHLGYPEVSARYNAIGSFSRTTEVATRTTQPLSADGDASAFKAFAWRFTNIVSLALVALGKRPTFDLIRQYVVNIESLFDDYCLFVFSKPTLLSDSVKNYLALELENSSMDEWLKKQEQSIKENQLPINLRGRKKRTVALLNFVKEYRIFEPVLDGLRSAVEYDKSYFDKITASLLPLLEKLTTGKTSALIAPDYYDLEDERPIFDWMQIIRKKGIVYVGLDALSDAEVAAAVGNSMFSDIVSTAGYIYKHGTEHGLGGDEKVMPKICLHADEFNELMGDEFIPLVNKAGGAGIQVTAYTQTFSDIEAKIGSKAKAGQTVGNFGNVIMFRVRETETAELLTKQLPKVEVLTMTAVSSASDSSDPHSSTHFTSSSQDRISSQIVPMIEPSDIIGLPKGQAFALIEGGNLFKIRMPLPVADENELPDFLKILSSRMTQNYHSSEGWWNVSSPHHAMKDF